EPSDLASNAVAATEIPQEPVLVRHVATRPTVVPLRELLADALEVGQQRAGRWTAALDGIQRAILPVREGAAIALEPEPIEESPPTDQDHVPEAGDPLRVCLDRYLRDELIEQPAPASIVPRREVLRQLVQRRELHRRAHEQDRLALLATGDDLVGGPDAVNVGWAVGGHGNAGVHHPEVDVDPPPEPRGASRPGPGPDRPRPEGPSLPLLGRGLVLLPILMETPNLGLEPRIEDGDAQGAEELADPVPPSGSLLHGARRDEIHRPRKV